MLATLAVAMMLGMFTMSTMFAMPIRLTRATSVAAATMRRAARRPHLLGMHPVHDAVEFFDDPIEAAGRIPAGPPRPPVRSGCGPIRPRAPPHTQPRPAISTCDSSSMLLIFRESTADFAGAVRSTVCC
jgi:hypothetical protein